MSLWNRLSLYGKPVSILVANYRSMHSKKVGWIGTHHRELPNIYFNSSPKTHEAIPEPKSGYAVLPVKRAFSWRFDLENKIVKDKAHQPYNRICRI